MISVNPQEMFLTVSSARTDAVKFRFSTVKDAMAAVDILTLLYQERGYKLAGGYDVTEVPGNQETVYVLIAPKSSEEPDIRLQIAPAIRRL